MRTKLPKFIIVQKKKISHSLSSQEEILHLRSTLSKHFRTSSTSLPSQHSSDDDSRDETCKNDHRPKKRSITFLILARRDPPPSIDSFKHFRTSPTCLDPLTTSPHNIPALHNSGNVSKHSLTFHLFDEKNDPTRSSNRPLKSDHQPCHASGAEARYRGGETWLAYLATRWTARRSRRAGGCIYEGARLGEASVIGIDVPRRRSASSREHERVLTAAGLDGLAVRRESGGYVLVTREALAR